MHIVQAMPVPKGNDMFPKARVAQLLRRSLYLTQQTQESRHTVQQQLVSEDSYLPTYAAKRSSDQVKNKIIE